MSLSNMSEGQQADLKVELQSLMPMNSMIMDMWGWDLHFEDHAFDDCFFEVAFGSEKLALEKAPYLKDDVLKWIDEYKMDYAQEMYNKNDFEKWIYDECVKFIKEWRANILASGIMSKILLNQQ